MPTKVGTKGQMVISKEVRDRLGVRPGWFAVQRLVDDHMEVYFLPPEHNRSLKGILAEYIIDLPSDVGWTQLKEEAWKRAAEEREAMWVSPNAARWH